MIIDVCAEGYVAYIWVHRQVPGAQNVREAELGRVCALRWAHNDAREGI